MEVENRDLNLLFEIADMGVESDYFPFDKEEYLLLKHKYVR